MTRSCLVVVLCLAALVGRAGAAAPLARLDLHGDPLPEGALARLGSARWQHEGAVVYLAFTPDGERLVTARQSALLCCTACHGHPFIPPNELPTPFSNTTFRVWDANSGRELAHFGEDHPSPRQPSLLGSGGQLRVGGKKSLPDLFAALAPDGKILLTAGPDGKIRLRELLSGKVKGVYPAPVGLAGIAFSPDGKALAVHSRTQGVRLLKSETGEEIRLLGKPEEFSKAAWGDELAFSSGLAGPGRPLGSKYLAVGLTEGERGLLLVFDLASGKEVWRTAERVACCSAFRFVPGSSILAWPTADGTVRLTDVSSGKEIKRLGSAGKSDYLAALAFSPEGRSLATLGFDQSVRLWDVGTGKERHTLRPGLRFGNPLRFGLLAASTTNGLAFSPDGKRLAAGSVHGLVQFWDVATGKDLYPGHEGTITGVSVSADGLTVATRGADRTARTWQVRTGKELNRVRVPTNAMDVVFSPDGKAASFSVDRETLQFWDVAAGKGLRQVKTATPGVGNCVGVKDSRKVAFSPDGKFLAELAPDLRLRVWEVAGGVLRHEQQLPRAYSFWLLRDGEPFPRLVFSPGGRHLAVLEPGGEEEPQWLNLIDLQRGRTLLRVKLPQGSTPFAFTPDERTLVVAEPAGGLRVWELASLKERGRVATGGKPLVALACFPSGTLLAGGTASGTIRALDLWAGKEVGTLESPQHNLERLVFSADAKILVSASADGTALVWDASRFKGEAGGKATGSAARLWEDLAEGDARKAFAAMQGLRVLGGPALAEFRRRLAPVSPLDGKGVAGLIADLGSGDFAKGAERASRELEKLGDLAAPALKEVIAGAADLEARKRAQRLLVPLESLPAGSAEELRCVRAVEVLERLGTGEARDLLRELARGAGGARLTREASAAVGRMRP